MIRGTDNYNITGHGRNTLLQQTLLTLLTLTKNAHNTRTGGTCREVNLGNTFYYTSFAYSGDDVRWRTGCSITVYEGNAFLTYLQLTLMEMRITRTGITYSELRKGNTHFHPLLI